MIKLEVLLERIRLLMNTLNDFFVNMFFVCLYLPFGLCVSQEFTFCAYIFLEEDIFDEDVL